MSKFLFVVPSFASGGAERAVTNLASELVRQGENVTVVKYFNMEQEYMVDERVHVINLSGGNMDVYENIGYLKKIRMLREILKAQNPDYILPFLPQVTLHTALAGFDMGKKIIHTVRNNPVVMPPNKMLRFVCNAIIRFSWKTIVQNETQKVYYPKKIHNKIYVLFNAVSAELLHIERRKIDSTYTIIAVGRLEPQKNFSMLLRGMKIVHEKHPDVILRIYGEGSLHEQLQTEIVDIGLSGIAQLMGRTNDMKSVYTSADMFVLSSDFEGMPNTLIEAMAVGLPCVSTNCPTGPTDLIENMRNGILVPLNDEKALGYAICRMIENSAEAEAMSVMARKTIREKCSAESIVKQLIRICRE